MADFYAFAGAHPWLTFFLGCLVVSACGALASFRPIVIKIDKRTKDAPEQAGDAEVKK